MWGIIGSQTHTVKRKYSPTQNLSVGTERGLIIGWPPRRTYKQASGGVVGRRTWECPKGSTGGHGWPLSVAAWRPPGEQDASLETGMDAETGARPEPSRPVPERSPPAAERWHGAWHRAERPSVR